MNTPVFSQPVRVYWEDTDAGGVVYYANYLKFFERTRTEWLRSIGLNQQALREETGGVFVVSEASVKYHRSARLDDLLTVTARLQQRGKASVVFVQQAWRGDIEQGELLAEGSFRVGWVKEASMQPARMPPQVLQALGAAQVGSGA